LSKKQKKTQNVLKKQVKRNGRREDVGELAIAFGSLDELNKLIERLRGSPN
jgi:ParB family chromosome partitioning protein